MIVTVQFKGSSRFYNYNTKVDNLIINGWYDIVVDDVTIYSNPVKILGFNPGTDKNYRTITRVRCLTAPAKPHPYRQIYVNKKKEIITVVWKDGTHTMIKCQDGDDFDIEKRYCNVFHEADF